MNKLIIMIITLLSVTSAAAQNDSIVDAKISSVSQMIGFGTTNILDTYLSHEHFDGAGMTFLSTVERRKPGSAWSTLMEHQANMSLANDRNDKANEIEGAYDFYWGKMYQWALMDRQLLLQAGGMVNAGIGFIYNTVNGNNPAQGRLHLNIMPTATATYRFKLLGRQAAARYELQLPLIGLMFSPNYGQSYYEIFSRGNYDNNAVPTTFICAPNFRQQVMLDVNISRKMTLRLGYLGDYQQASVNNLKQHIYSHRMMIGVVRNFRLINYRNIEH